MGRLAGISKHVPSLIGFGLVAALALGLILSLSGQRVSAVFSTINSGLSEGAMIDSGLTGEQAVPPLDGQAGQAYPLPQPAGAAQDRLVIRSASLQIQVADVDEADVQARALVDRAGGYIVSSSTTGEGNGLLILISARVPAAQFDATLSATQALAARVLGRSLAGQDVTEEFVDLKARLHNLEATRDRVEGFLGQAKKVDEALLVNTTLSDLQGQIEQIKGRIQYLSESSAFSTIELTIQPVPVVPLTSEEGWQPVAVARGALHDVIATGQVLINALIVIAIWSPLTVLPLFLVGWGWRRLTHGAR
jgi:hypothetical protein